MRTRRITPREEARLIRFLHDSFPLACGDSRYDALVGDGVVVARWLGFLAENILEPILAANSATQEAAGTQVGTSPPIDPWGLARRRGQAEAR